MPGKLKTIEQEWTEFSGMIFHKVKPAPNQVEEMKKAFFAGAYAILCAVRNVGEPEVSGAQGIEFLEARQQEGKKFYRELMRNYSQGN